MTTESLFVEAQKLSVADRLRLAEEMWDSVWKEQLDLPLTAEQRDELDRRLADCQANPDSERAWGDVRNRIEQKL